MKKVFAALTAMFFLSGCGGGSSGNGTGSPEDGLSHNQLAEVFVRELNATGIYKVEMAKGSTEQGDFIVIYDEDLGEYDAINIRGFRPGMDPVSFLETNTNVYYDLDYIPGYWTTAGGGDFEIDIWHEARYHDRYSGLYFEKIEASSKDLETLGALVEAKVIDSRAESVAAKFGLSVERSREVVRLAMTWERAGGKDLTAQDQDAFSNELLGFSITEAKSAAQAFVAGDGNALEALVETAAVTNETTPENIGHLIGEYFGVR